MIIKLLSNEHIEKIKEKSLEILENIGVVIPHSEIISKFQEYGAHVDSSKNLVKIPPNLTEKLVSKAGRKFTIYGRDLKKQAKFGENIRNYNTSGGQALWIDNIGEKRRYSTLQDVVTATKFADQLDEITIPGAMADPHDIPIAWRCVNVALEMIKNTNKPITFWFYDRKSTKFLVELLISLRGDAKNAEKYPLFYPLFEPVSPLTFPFHGIDLLYETAKVGMPVQIGPMAQMGITAPATFAGTLAQENAEILAGICITQLIKEGLPICYGGICHAFDMKSMQIIFGGPEQILFSIAMAEIGKSYGFPIYINTGLTDSKLPDAQAGLECGMTLAMGAASGADIFGHMGISGADQAASLDMLVLQSEIISYIESMHRKINLDDSDFALNIIKEIGPKGSFISHRHTFDHFRNELWFPSLIDRSGYEKWMEKGAKNLKMRCEQKKNEILNIQSKSLDSDIIKDLEDILKEAKNLS